MEKLIKLFPQNVVDGLKYLTEKEISMLTEIRFRVNKPVYVYVLNKEYALSENGLSKKDGIIFTLEDAGYFWKRLCDGAPYSVTDKQRAGYITVNGNRVGFCGEFAHVDGQVRHIKNASSFCIRIKHEITGCANKIYKYIFNNSEILNTLIVSPPGCGKTTMLRDISRLLSFDGYNISIADEREEIAAAVNGIPTLDVGKRTDVFSGIDKAYAIENMIRSLKPQIIIADEIGNEKDFIAIKNASDKGVNIIASAHGRKIEDVKQYSYIFDRYIFLSNKFDMGTVEKICDKDLKDMSKKICC